MPAEKKEWHLAAVGEGFQALARDPTQADVLALTVANGLRVGLDMSPQVARFKALARRSHLMDSLQ